MNNNLVSLKVVYSPQVRTTCGGDLMSLANGVHRTDFSRRFFCQPKAPTEVGTLNACSQSSYCW